MSLYLAIGRPQIERIIQVFYEKCLSDPMLAHFFWETDHQHLVAMQVHFVSNMLGGPKTYQGRPLVQAHSTLMIRPPHFARRQRILQETMQELGLEAALAQQWLDLEERFKSLILTSPQSCHD